MRLPTGPNAQTEINRQLELADLQNVKKGTDIDMSGGDAIRKPRIILVAPNGSRWVVLVNNAGALSTAAL